YRSSMTSFEYYAPSGHGRQGSILRPDPPARSAPCGGGTDLRTRNGRGTGAPRLQIERRDVVPPPARTGETGLSQIQNAAAGKTRAARLSRDTRRPQGAGCGQEQGARTFWRAD